MYLAGNGTPRERHVTGSVSKGGGGGSCLPPTLRPLRRNMRSTLAVLLLACTLARALLPGTTMLRPRCISIRSSCGVRALAANSKRKGKGKAPPKGFGAPLPSPPPPPARAVVASGSPQLMAVDLGRGKQVSVMLPPPSQEPTEAELRRLETSADAVLQQDVLGAYKHLYGAGDVVWPASVALARLLAHVPSFSEGQRVLELGCGLGAVGLAAGTAGAASVVLTDREAPLLALADQVADAPRPGLHVVAGWMRSAAGWMRVVAGWTCEVAGWMRVVAGGRGQRFGGHRLHRASRLEGGRGRVAPGRGGGALRPGRRC